MIFVFCIRTHVIAGRKFDDREPDEHRHRIALDRHGGNQTRHAVISTDIHRRTMEVAGLGHACLNAWGYTMGISHPPSGVDWPMLWTGTPDPIEEGRCSSCT